MAVTERQSVLRRRTMTGRDPGQTHRASTPLELLFDLCFVVAVSQAAAELHHELAAGEVAHSVVAYLSVFFAIWWAWMNFTWFASAYDTDDIPYRLLTLLQITGVLVLASGIDRVFADDFKLVTVGYVIMRVAMISQWLRAAASDPAHADVARRYALASFVIQIGWIVRLFLPDALGMTTFLLLIGCELLGPLWAERVKRGRTATPWHPEHIAERYGLFTIIVLGECILSAFVAINDAISDGGVSAELIIIAIGGLVAMFGLWWTYFRMSPGEMLKRSPHLAFVWGYGHYVLFATIAAFGAGIAVAADWSIAHDTVGHADGSADGAAHFALGDIGTAMAVGIPVGLAMLLLTGFRVLAHEDDRVADVVGVVIAVGVLVAAALAGVIGVAASLLIIGALVTVKVALDCVTEATPVGATE